MRCHGYPSEGASGRLSVRRTRRPSRDKVAFSVANPSLPNDFEERHVQAEQSMGFIK